MKRVDRWASMSDEDKLLDRDWRLWHLYHITDKAGVLRLFRPNRAQRQLLGNLHGRDVILKARQLGMTTLMCIIALDECLFIDNWRVAIIAHRLDDAKTIFESKIKFAYDMLDPELRESRPTIKDSADSLSFSNGSSISVTTSARSGTLQRLHVSEFGAICARYPNKAREIITGSFPAAERGVITIESTAEGQEGKFFDMAQQARDLIGKTHGPKDHRFHFFPWYDDPGYVYDPELVITTPEHEAYFAKLESETGDTLSPAQRAWWIKTEREQGGDMKREYPATPDEAFEQAIEGAYFERQIAHAVKIGSVARYPYDPRYEVNTFWDLGRNDMTTIWLHQFIDRRNRFIGYYEASGEHISHYVLWLKEWARLRDRVKWGDHYWPHDGDRDDLFLEQGRLAEVAKTGFNPRIVPRPQIKLEAIDAGRAVFASCDFDEAECATGLHRLRHYRKEWDDQRGVWRDRPRHDENSHGADSFLTFACGWKAPSAMKKQPRKQRSAWAA
jgi:hypothetical protein